MHRMNIYVAEITTSNLNYGRLNWINWNFPRKSWKSAGNLLSWNCRQPVHAVLWVNPVSWNVPAQACSPVINSARSYYDHTSLRCLVGLFLIFTVILWKVWVRLTWNLAQIVSVCATLHCYFFERMGQSSRSKQPYWKSSSCSSSTVHGFYQRVSIASYASAGIARAEMSVCLSVRLSVTLRYCIKTKKVIVMIFHHPRARTF